MAEATMEKVTRLSLANFIPSPEAIAQLSEQAARRLNVVPLAKLPKQSNTNNSSWRLVFACENPADPILVERLSRQLAKGMTLSLVQGEMQDIHQALQRCYEPSEAPEALLSQCRCSVAAGRLLQEHADAIVRLLEWILLCACRQGASDIHLSPEKQQLHIRFRVDGVLRTFNVLSHVVFSGLLVRIKILASIDIAETRRPQDGQFSQLVDARAIDFRVSCFPTTVGQNTVIRLLDPQRELNSLSSLRLPKEMQEQLLALNERPDGLVLVCGPTGSGKSTTLHAFLHECDVSTLNIMTLEDPVEQTINGIRQSSIDVSSGMDFAEGVRGLLRQDPDVLLIGEIRDTPSCAMAMRAVMSGHKVLTSVHAASALAGLSRLRELGAQSRQLANNVLAIVSQRLLRRRCRVCQQGKTECSNCQGTGYQGRQVAMELLLVTPSMAALIAADASREALLACALEDGFVSLREQGRRLVERGVTTLEEIDRVLGQAREQDSTLLTTRRYGA